jgi:hypothetical protein
VLFLSPSLSHSPPTSHHNIVYVQQTVKAKEQKTSCERYIELKMENNKFIVRSVGEGEVWMKEKKKG